MGTIDISPDGRVKPKPGQSAASVASDQSKADAFFKMNRDAAAKMGPRSDNPASKRRKDDE